MAHGEVWPMTGAKRFSLAFLPPDDRSVIAPYQHFSTRPEQVNKSHLVFALPQHSALPPCETLVATRHRVPGFDEWSRWDKNLEKEIPPFQPFTALPRFSPALRASSPISPLSGGGATGTNPPRRPEPPMKFPE